MAPGGSEIGSRGSTPEHSTAYVAQSSFGAADLPNLPTRGLIHSNWDGGGEGGLDFTQRLAERQSLAGSADSTPRTIRTSASDTFSMAMTLHSHTRYPESLASSRDIPSSYYGPTATASSISSRQAWGIAKGVLNVDHEGVAEAPAPQGRLQCSFARLGCSEAFDGLELWDTHCLSHYRGAALPMRQRCPFTCDWEVTAEDGQSAWNERYHHVRTDHNLDLERIDVNRNLAPDAIQHLFRNRIIDDRQMRDLRANRRLSGDRPPVLSIGRSGRDERRHDRARAGGPARPAQH